VNLVVGSGPAGVAAALALLERGQAVTMLDAGRTIEPEIAETPQELAKLPYEQWPKELVERLASLSDRGGGDYPMKTNFGSDFAYRGAPDRMPIETHGADIIVSLARGGLSNIWGSNVVTFCAQDFIGWPFGERELAAAYRAVLHHVPLSAARGDDFENDLPLHTDSLEPRFLSTQAELLLGDLAAGREAVHALGVRFGPSRLGLRTRPSEHDPGCVRCGLCLHGCPYDLIYSSTQTLPELLRHERFRYVGDAFVDRFRETQDGVVVETRSLDGRATARFEGERLFLGCGGYSTARLVLHSLEQYGRELTMLESQYFLIPLLHGREVRNAPNERLQTLSQVCLRLRDETVTPRDVQMLVYGYSRLFDAALRSSPARFLPPVARALRGRLLALQGYLHSDVSAQLTLALRRDASGPPVLTVRGRTNPETRPTIGRVTSRVRALARWSRAHPIPFMTKIAPPGKSYHTGGTFPMRDQPSERDSDALGRPSGLARVHLVDASVFPTVPATNLTLTVMANSYRIAADSTRLAERSGESRARMPA
jgi:choline dehydrogenase-like flavoprotein